MVCLLQNVKGKLAVPAVCVWVGVCTVPYVRTFLNRMRLKSGARLSLHIPSHLPNNALQRWLHVEATSSDNSYYISLLTSWSWSFSNVH